MRERVAKGTPRIVFCDLDDTFLSTDKHLIDRNMAALDELARRGIPFVPCTGRGLNGVLLNEALAAHPSVRYAITSSGSVVYDMRTREVIHGRIVGAERALKLLFAQRMCQPRTIGCNNQRDRDQQCHRNPVDVTGR